MMKARSATLLLVALASTAPHSDAQVPVGDAPASIPHTIAAIGDWDASIVRRAAAMIASPAQWNRSDAGPCKHDAKTVNLRCALERAIAEAGDPSGGSVKATATLSQPVDCRLAKTGVRVEGNCGLLFEEPAVFSIVRANAITTGAWRSDVAPTVVWAGKMRNAQAAVMQEARRLVDATAPGKYRKARLAEFNSDSSVTFADLQAYFRTLEGRVRKVTIADHMAEAEDVEIELYAGGTGVIRTYNGWYKVSGYSADESSIRFQFDTTTRIAPNALDREIIVRANALLSSDAVWNRNDNRECDAAAKTWSIYCALEHATRVVTGGFHHRRPALELVRVIVEDRTKDRDYAHRLMDYNNDVSTHLNDVRMLFAEALKRASVSR